LKKPAAKTWRNLFLVVASILAVIGVSSLIKGVLIGYGSGDICFAGGAILIHVATPPADFSFYLNFDDFASMIKVNPWMPEFTRIYAPFGNGHISQTSVPVWMPTLVLAGLACFFHRRHKRTARSPGICQNCGYDLQGNISGRCPECGVEI
jgi:hypothetical protein